MTKFLSTRNWQNIIGGLMRLNRWSLPWKPLHSYGAKNDGPSLRRLWVNLLPDESISSVEAMMEMGIVPILISPDVRQAAEILRLGPVEGQKPYLALAVLGVRHGNVSCEALRRFIRPFEAGRNEPHDITCGNVTLNVSNLFKPGQGIFVGDIKRLVEGQHLEVLQYHSTKLLRVDVDTLVGDGTKSLRLDKHLETKEDMLIRMLRRNRETVFSRRN